MTMAWMRARLTARDAELPRESCLAPGVALGVEELLHVWVGVVVMNVYVQGQHHPARSVSRPTL